MHSVSGQVKINLLKNYMICKAKKKSRKQGRGKITHQTASMEVLKDLNWETVQEL